MIINFDGSQRKVIFECDGLIEAPNWSSDGNWLIFNRDGKLFRINLQNPDSIAAIPLLINTGNVHNITNDHVIAPDGKTIFFTANGVVYVVPFAGGTPRQISMQLEDGVSTQYYVHGISPDGQTLSCIGYTVGSAGALAIYLIPASGGMAQKITDTKQPVDGAEFSLDGQWIYFNGELHAREPGDSQIYRMRIDGSDIQQLTFDARVNWFPHVSPDANHIVYLSYPQHTQGHPANVEVILRQVSAQGGTPVDVVHLSGGQGTINTNSWAPDSQRFAFVDFSR